MYVPGWIGSLEDCWGEMGRLGNQLCSCNHWDGASFSWISSSWLSWKMKLSSFTIIRCFRKNNLNSKEKFKKSWSRYYSHSMMMVIMMNQATTTATVMIMMFLTLSLPPVWFVSETGSSPAIGIHILSSGLSEKKTLKGWNDWDSSFKVKT